DSIWVELVGVTFMFIGGANFALHFQALRRGRVVHYWRDPEFRAYVLLLAGLVTFVSGYLLLDGYFNDVGTSLRQALFHSISIMTTSGFAAGNFSAWPGMLPVLLVLSSFVGACAYST